MINTIEHSNKQLISTVESKDNELISKKKS